MPCERAKTHNNYSAMLNHGANTHLGLLSNEVAWSSSGRNYTVRVAIVAAVLAVVAVMVTII
jgi:hypothetical protein